MSGTAARIRLLLADDHELVREGLAAILADEPGLEVVAKVGSGAEACRLWRELRPDVGLIDMRLGDIDGTQVIRTIRGDQPDAALIILSTFDVQEDVDAAMRAGAMAYLLKDCPRRRLLACIQKVAADAPPGPD